MIIGCGGTGGHITPALAIANTIKENAYNARILFVGAKGGMEEELVSSAGYDIHLLSVRGLKRSLTPANIKTLYLAQKAVREAAELVRGFVPDIVIGTGGYACYPALRAAVKTGVPTAVHESNALPGLAVRRMASSVDRIWLNFGAAANHLPPQAPVLTVGNPLPGGYALPRPYPLPQGRRELVLSFGGSLGSRALNEAVLDLMEQEAKHPEIYHLHATGKREFDAVWSEFCKRGLDRIPSLSLVPYLSDMPRWMAAATLVICRAGAMTLSELAALGRPAILVPSPNVVANHQYENAKALKDAGAAVLLEERELSHALRGTVFSLLGDKTRQKQLSKAIAQFHNPRANARIWQDIQVLCRNRK